MAATDMAEAEEPAKSSKKPLIIGAALALVLGGGAFFALYSGLILGGDPTDETAAGAHGGHGKAAESGPLDVAFVPIEKMIISLGPESASRHLRFEAQLEVTPAYQEDVTLLMPRVLDVLNSYLRAVDMAELEDPTTLITLRAQMLRRVQLVTGNGRVRDLLITEFVLN
ncbi:flagellar basal body-associated FliL family protein [Rhodovulum sulfidophilum]|nr:flagellar basal body-associated FliL family protein [Rhodovulum sulfidophilum]ANB32863.1 flagellar basal body protein FliL [Rhodovulum sulfidophilum DSM 1374]ANB36712.1 flagellar basal body protein FliL [Rhodovulum sulfidophilum]MCE8420303.1 flagellar basal body-associated FliL family protein [Rhodovulum sulfidophilum]MCE8430413.1 flagellar basal body-associated FliL family protein [Rhodovulum sulfidophilum]MCE8438599.1 flagellar basal body-associated FliL family protein [Rhodovulum sulfido